MSDNGLLPGNGGLAAPSPADAQAVLPQNALTPPPPGPSEMQKFFLSEEDKLAAQFEKVKHAKSLVDATSAELQKLSAFADTVTMDDVIEAASTMVAAGVPAVQVASTLAEIPESPSMLAAWVQEQNQKIIPMQAQIDQAYQTAGYKLGLSAMKSIMAHSAEEHFAKTRN